MTPEQWSVVNRIFHDATDLPLAERRAFVEHEAGGDLTIESAVTELLRSDSRRGDYLSLPAAATPEFQSLLLSPAGSTTLLQSGDLLCERFQIVRQLGEGGMGQVYEALDQELQVRVALKVIQPEIAALEGMTNRFRHEVRLARSITHPNICRTFDLERGAIADAAGISRDLIFLTMEYLEGETLAVRLARSAPLSLHDAMTIAGQLAEGIEAAHRHGVVHRDLKPQNVLLARAENSDAGSIRVVIMDFGLARLNPASFALTQKSATSQHGQVAGTFTYMAPEQIGGGPALPASDIYSFGLILLKWSPARRPFRQKVFCRTLAVASGTIRPRPERSIHRFRQFGRQLSPGASRGAPRTALRPPGRSSTHCTMAYRSIGAYIRLPQLAYAASRRASFCGLRPPPSSFFPLPCPRSFLFRALPRQRG